MWLHNKEQMNYANVKDLPTVECVQAIRNPSCWYDDKSKTFFFFCFCTVSEGCKFESIKKNKIKIKTASFSFNDQQST
jgi:hypothetical protein